jgi:hypothetical protein
MRGERRRRLRRLDGDTRCNPADSAFVRKTALEDFIETLICRAGCIDGLRRLERRAVIAVQAGRAVPLLPGWGRNQQFADPPSDDRFWRNRRLRPKTAFSRLPLVHGADLEGHQRVDFARPRHHRRTRAICALQTVGVDVEQK